MQRFFDSVWEEAREWGKVFLQHWVRVVGSATVLVLLVVLFQLALVGLRFVDSMMAYVSSEVDILVDIEANISEERIVEVMEEIRMMDGIAGVAYITADDALGFVHEEVVPGYADFLKNNRLPNPFSPLLRIQIVDATLFTSLQQELKQRYEGILVGQEVGVDRVVQSLSDEAVLFGLKVSSISWWITWVVGGLTAIAYGFFVWELLRLRKHEFSLVALVGMPYGFYRWSYWGAALLMSLIVFVLGFVCFWLVSGIWGSYPVLQVMGLGGLGLVVAELGYRV